MRDEPSRSVLVLCAALGACSIEKKIRRTRASSIRSSARAGTGTPIPGRTVPFGMVQVSPDTRLTGWDGCSAYHYSDSVVYGFSHTHLSGTGCSDYGDILLMPTVGAVQLDRGDGKNPGVGLLLAVQPPGRGGRARLLPREARRRRRDRRAHRDEARGASTGTPFRRATARTSSSISRTAIRSSIPASRS